MKLNWGSSIAIVYLAFMVFMISAVVVTVRRGVNLVTPNYYEKGLSVQGEIDARSNLLHLEKKVALVKEGGVLILKIPTAQPSEGMVHLYRPSSFKLDKMFPLALEADSTMRVKTGDLARGEWVVKIVWTSDSIAYQFDGEINLK